MKSEYPLRIRFWYIVHDRAERLWHWVYREKIAPWHAADRERPQVPPSFRLVQTIEPTEHERAAGITAKHVYARAGSPDLR